MQFAVVAKELNMRIAIIPKENEKSEPFSNRKQVRIFLVWWARVDYASRASKKAPQGPFCRRDAKRRALRVALADFSATPWRGLEKSERCPSLASLFPPQADGLRHPASAAPCLRIAGRGPNNSSLLPPLAALVVVAVGSAAVRIHPCDALQTSR